MLLNGTKTFRFVSKDDVQAKHTASVKRISEITRIPEEPLKQFVDRAYTRHVQAFDKLTKWAGEDYEIVTKVVGVKTGAPAVEQTIDLTKVEDNSN